MSYDDLVADIAARAGLSTDIVKKVLFHLPDALLQLGLGNSVRTPLGIFRMMKHKGRKVMLPDQVREATVPDRVVVKLRPGSRIKFSVDS